MRKRFIFAIAAVLLLAATAITFARNTSATSISISAGAQSGVASTISTSADALPAHKLKYSPGAAWVTPTWSPVMGDPGSITAGDIYYIDTTSYTGDVIISVYLTNPDELHTDYSYLNMNVSVWFYDTDHWAQASLSGGGTGDTSGKYLTLNNGYLSFIVAGNAEYCVSVDGGEYYCIDTTEDATHSLDPAFYMEVDPL